MPEANFNSLLFCRKKYYNSKGYAKFPSNSFAEIFVNCPIKNPAMSRV
jgi:hypothetical protein